MKKKFAFALLTVLVVAVLGFSFSMGSDKNKILKVNAEEWGNAELKESYVVGESVKIPSLSVKVGDATVNATYSVIFPDKTATDAETVVLSQVGDYSVEYYASYSGKHYSVTKNFKVTSGVYTVSGSNSTAEYGVYNDYGCTTEGVITSLALNDTLTFANLIDVSDLSAGNPFVSLFIVPEKRGEADFNKLIVTLTDALNPDVYLRYEINRYTTNTTQSLNMVWISVGGNGQDQLGYEPKSSEALGYKVHLNDNLGLNIGGVSFVAQKNSDGWGGSAVDSVPDAKPLTLAYDKATNSAKAGGQEIADMDGSPDYGTMWYGFTSGKVRLSITASKYANSYAKFVVTDVLGTDLTYGEDGNVREFVDTEAPELTVDMDEMPLGQAGMRYAVPEASAVDWYSGVCDVKTTVYYDYATENQITVSVKNGEFIPPYTGSYVIEYLAKDSSGNEAKVLKTVKVKKSLGDIAIGLPAARIESAEIGDYVTVSEPESVSGGSGHYTVKTYVSYAGGEKQEIDGKFLPEQAGEWMVSYVVTDYVGNEKTESYVVTVAATDKPKFNVSPVLPEFFFDKVTATLPEIYANDYSGGSKVEKLAKVEIIDANGANVYDAGATFVPSVANSGDEVKVRYYYGETSLATVSIPAVKVKNGSKILLNNYLYGNVDVTSDVSDSLAAELGSSVDLDGEQYYLVNGLLVTAKESGNAGWTFINSLKAEGLSVSLSAVKSITAYDRLAVTLKDYESGESVTMYVTVLSNGSNVTVGDSTIASVSSLNDSSITIGYSDGSMIFGVTKVDVTKFDSGKDFDGFASGKVYLTVTMENATAGSGYIVNSVNGAVLSYRNNDNSRPTVSLEKGLGGYKDLNATLTIPKASVSDVYSPYVTATLTVYAPDGSVATASNGVKLQNVPSDAEYTLTLSDFGNYTLSYALSKGDFSSVKLTPVTYTVQVIDNVAPVITVGTVTETVKKGEAFVLPSVTVTDNASSGDGLKVSKYIVTSSGKYVLIGSDYDAYIPSNTGKYQFIVFAIDEAGNASSVRYAFSVTE